MHTIERAKAHGNRLQALYAGGDPFRVVAQVQQQGDAVQGVLHRSSIVERQLHREVAVIVQQAQRDARGRALLVHQVHEGALFARPVQVHAAAVEPGTDGFAHNGVVAAIDDRPHIAEELHLLERLLPIVREIACVRRTYVGEDADVGTDDGAQRVHFARLADARFEQRQRMLRRQFPHAQGHAQAAVPRSRAAHDPFLVMEHLEEPLLHHRLAIAAGDADHAGVVVPAVPRGHAVQGVPGIVHVDRIAPGRHRGTGAHEEMAHPALVHGLQVGMAIVVRAFQRHEERAVLRYGLARVDDQVLHTRLAIT